MGGLLDPNLLCRNPLKVLAVGIVYTIEIDSVCPTERRFLKLVDGKEYDSLGSP